MKIFLTPPAESHRLQIAGEAPWPSREASEA